MKSSPVRLKSKPVAQLKVLVVDDDQAICDYLTELLTPDDCDVASVSDPEQALELIREERFHIVTLDLMMPQMGGIELLQRIRDTDREIAVIILTGYPSVETATDAINLDVSAYMQKPFSADEIRDTIARVVRKKGIVVRREDEMHIIIGANIRRLRKQRGLTLKELGRRSSISVSLLSHLERAEGSVSVSSLFRIATALGAKVTDLLGDY